MLFCRLVNSRSVLILKNSCASIAYCYRHGGGGDYDGSAEGVRRVSRFGMELIIRFGSLSKVT